MLISPKYPELIYIYIYIVKYINLVSVHCYCQKGCSIQES